MYKLTSLIPMSILAVFLCFSVQEDYRQHIIVLTDSDNCSFQYSLLTTTPIDAGKERYGYHDKRNKNDLFINSEEVSGKTVETF